MDIKQLEANEAAFKSTPLILKKRLLSGSAWAFFGRISLAITGILITALLTRLLSPEVMGAYLLAFSLVSVCVLIGQLGFNQTVVKYVAESMTLNKPARARAVIIIIFKYSLPATLLLVFVFMVGFWRWLVTYAFNVPMLTSVSKLAGIWILVLTCQKLLSETFRGFQDIRLAVLFGDTSTKIIVILLLGLFWATYGEAELHHIILLFIVSSSVVAVIATFSLYRKIKSINSSNEQHQLNDRQVLTDTWPFLVTNLTLFVLLQVDIWIISAFSSKEDVALYGIAARLVLLVGLPLLVANAVAPPLIAEMYSQGRRKELEKILRVVATIISVPALFALTGFVLFGASMLRMFFGEFYTKGAPTLILLGIGNTANVLAGSCGNMLMMAGHQKTMMKISIFSGLILITGALVTVSHYGAVGVAAVAAFAMIIQNILMLFLAKKKTDIWTHASFSGWPIRQMIRRYIS